MNLKPRKPKARKKSRGFFLSRNFFFVPGKFYQLYHVHYFFNSVRFDKGHQEALPYAIIQRRSDNSLSRFQFLLEFPREK